MPKGRVFRVDSACCVVKDAEGYDLRCLIPGIMKKDDVGVTNPVAVGDYIIYEEEATGEAVVREVLERKNKLSRSYPDQTNREQVIVSNVDQMMIVSSVRDPNLRTAFIDRLLVAAEYAKLRAIIVINKMDIEKKKNKALEAAEVYRQIGYPVILASAVTGLGIDEIREHLRGRTSVISGHSGVGKSTLLNCVAPELDLPVGDVSRKTGKGTHTTTWAELYELPFGGWIADTPGMRSLTLWNVPSDDVDCYFRELRPLINDCRFGAGCNHDNEPGCAVLKALEEGRISQIRYDGYRKLVETIEDDEDDRYY